jgi:oligopeptide/dipeptide ABC transporter ATP-binding protein
MLKVANLSVDYSSGDQATHALVDASFVINQGEIVGFVGESGSGKSTAALAVLGIVRGRGRIVEGTVEFEGRELLKLSEDGWRTFRGRQIGLVTQQPRAALNPVMRVGTQMVRMYRAHSDASEREGRARVLDLLRLVGINDPERRLDAYPHELSGGMAQRVLIATALSASPKLLIADEPTSGLDATVQVGVLDDLRKAASEVGSSVMLVTHDLGIVANYCDRVYVLEAGEIVEECPVAPLFDSPAHPASISLLASQSDLRGAFRLRGRPPDRVRLPSGCFVHKRCPLADPESGCMTIHPKLYSVNDDHRSRCHRFESLVQGLPNASHARA